MKIIHIMKDGTRRDSVEGVVITNKEFYEVLARHQRESDKRNAEKK